MMPRLTNQTQKFEIASQVASAHRLFSRLKGLLGRDNLPAGETLWLRPGNSVHTWFMKFPIDVIFVDRRLQVRAVTENLEPWKVIWPVWGAHSVFELKAGSLQSRVRIGDQLHVDD